MKPGVSSIFPWVQGPKDLGILHCPPWQIAWRWTGIETSRAYLEQEPIWNGSAGHIILYFKHNTNICIIIKKNTHVDILVNQTHRLCSGTLTFFNKVCSKIFGCRIGALQLQVAPGEQTALDGPEQGEEDGTRLALHPV